MLIRKRRQRNKSCVHVDHFRSVFNCLQQPRINDKDFTSSDELRLSMQPPRLFPKVLWLQSPSLKPDACQMPSQQKHEKRTWQSQVFHQRGDLGLTAAKLPDWPGSGFPRTRCGSDSYPICRR